MTACTMAQRPGPTTAEGAAPRYVVRRAGEAEPNEWNTALARSPQACVFLDATFLHSLARASGWPITLLGCYEQDRLVGGLAGRLCREGSATAFDRLLLVPYNGCWIDEGPAQLAHRRNHRRQAILAALATHVELGYAKAVIDLHPANVDARLFTWNNWSVSPRYTLITELSSAHPQDCSPDVRRRAHRAASSGVSFDPAVPSGEFSALWASSLDRQGVRHALPPSVLAELLDGVQRQVPLAIYGARLPGGRLVAGAAILFDQTTAYYWLAGYDTDEPAPGGSNQLCHLEMLRDVSRRVGRFDWVGANTRSVADYKEAFGPMLVPYYRAAWHRRREPERRTRYARVREWLRRRCGISSGAERPAESP